MVTLHTSYGDIELELFEEQAPKTCANFIQYVKDGFYTDTIFHRVINSFMIQGGGFSVDMQQKPTRSPIENEADNGIKNDIGTVAMARTNDPHSATAQFFINVAHNDFLNHTSKSPSGWGYAVFAKVSNGMDVVEKIKSVSTGNLQGHQDVPIETVIITGATLTE